MELKGYYYSASKDIMNLCHSDQYLIQRAGHKETMNMGYGLLSVHHRQKGYLSITMGTNPTTGLCIGLPFYPSLAILALDEVLDT